MATAVYVMCALTSAACAVLLTRSWLQSRVRLVMWTALGFVGLALNNLVLFVDRVLLTSHDLLLLRDATGLAAVSILLFGLIWEAR